MNVRESSVKDESVLNFIRDLFLLEPPSSTMDEFTHTLQITIPLCPAPPPAGREKIVA